MTPSDAAVGFARGIARALPSVFEETLEDGVRVSATDGQQYWTVSARAGIVVYHRTPKRGKGFSFRADFNAGTVETDGKLTEQDFQAVVQAAAAMNQL